MNNVVESRLLHNNIEIPVATKVLASYVPYRIHNNLVYISGQLPMWEGNPTFMGKVGKDIDLEQAQEAAALCALNILAQLKSACDGDLDRVDFCVRLGGFVNCTETYTDIHKVINGASDLMIKAFGEQGLHARAAIGVYSLPLGVAVEVEAIFALKA
ncbi:MAG: RidA family protein [Alphaproteobacteria bacterium]|nr:RidA family protein [Alphaproteobacteria bacterium]